MQKPGLNHINKNFVLSQFRRFGKKDTHRMLELPAPHNLTSWSYFSFL